MNFNIKLWFVIITAIAIIVRITFITREFVLEEAFHVRAARAVSQTGYPLLYYGEQEPRELIYLDRPPGLVILEAWSFKLFGISELSARIVPLLFFLGQLFLVFYFGAKFFGEKSRWAIVLAGLLLAIHPYLIQNSLMIHFDGAIFSFFSTFYLFLTLFKIIKKQNRWIDHLQLAAIFYFALWIKYDPALMMLAVVFIFTLFFYRPFVKKLILATLAASIFYFASFYLYNLAFGHSEGFWLPFKRMLSLSRGSFIPKLTSLQWLDKPLSAWAGSYHIGIKFLSWLSIPTILISFYTFIRFFQIKKLRSDTRIIFLVLWTLFFIFAYLLIGWPGDYPRYFAVSMPPLLLLVGFVVSQDFSKFKNLISLRSILLSVLLATVIVAFLTKYNFLFLDHITGWIPHLQIPFFALIFAGSLIIWLVSIWRKRVLMVALSIILLVNIYQIVVQTVHDLKSDYSLTNFYGSGAYRQAGVFLKERLREDAIILTFDPVGYYWGGKYYDWYPMNPYDTDNHYRRNIKAIFSGQIGAIALPSWFLNEVDFLAKREGLNFGRYRKENFRNYYNIGGERGIEIYY